MGGSSYLPGSCMSLLSRQFRSLQVWKRQPGRRGSFEKAGTKCQCQTKCKRAYFIWMAELELNLYCPRSSIQQAKIFPRKCAELWQQNHKFDFDCWGFLKLFCFSTNVGGFQPIPVLALFSYDLTFLFIAGELWMTLLTSITGISFFLPLSPKNNIACARGYSIFLEVFGLVSVFL